MRTATSLMQPPANEKPLEIIPTSMKMKVARYAAVCLQNRSSKLYNLYKARVLDVSHINPVYIKLEPKFHERCLCSKN